MCPPMIVSQIAVHFALPPVRRCPHVETVDRPELIVRNEWLKTFRFWTIPRFNVSTTPKTMGIGQNESYRTGLSVMR